MKHYVEKKNVCDIHIVFSNRHNGRFYLGILNNLKIRSTKNHKTRFLSWKCVIINMGYRYTILNCTSKKFKFSHYITVNNGLSLLKNYTVIIVINIWHITGHINRKTILFVICQLIIMKTKFIHKSYERL